MTKDDITFPTWATRNMVVLCPGREDAGRGASRGREQDGVTEVCETLTRV